MGIRNQFWMQVAEKVSSCSKDPNTKVGAVILDEDDRVVSTGYNGMLAGVKEESMWQGSRELKHHCVIHAEMNAMLFARRPLKGCVMYTTHGPCANCLKHALQAGINEIYYQEVYRKFTSEEKQAIYTMIYEAKAKVWNVQTNEPYIGELYA